MEERIDIALKRARQEYKDAYEYELDNKEDIDLSEEQYTYIRGLRDNIRELYWVKNEATVKFNKDKIVVKFITGDTVEY